MIALILRIVIPAIIIFVVSELSRRSPRLGALLLTLPLVSILAFVAAWMKDHDLKSLSQMSKETLILVPLGLPFFCRWHLPIGWVLASGVQCLQA